MTKQSSSKKSSSGAAAAEIFGPFVESNGNYIALRESMLAYANEQAAQPDFEDVLWQKPQDFAKSNDYQIGIYHFGSSKIQTGFVF